MRPVGYDEPQVVAPGVIARFRPAGHILGSSYVELDVAGTRVLFTGDLSPSPDPLDSP